MGLLDKMKDIFSKKEQQNLSSEENKNQSVGKTDDLNARYQKEMADFEKSMKKTEQDSKNFQNFVSGMNGRLESLNNAPGNSHLNSLINDQANVVKNALAKTERQSNRAKYLEQNSEGRLDTLLKKLKHNEMLAKLNIKGKYAGDYQGVLDQYNYEQLAISMEKHYLLFIPYLADLEKEGGFYEPDELPENIKAKYEEYKQNPLRRKYVSGFALGVMMGIYNLNDYQDQFNEKEEKTIQEFVQVVNESGIVQLAKKLPRELEQFVKPVDKDTVTK